MKNTFLAFCLVSFVSLNISAQNTLETIVQTGHSQAVTAIAGDPEGKFIVSGGKDKTLKLWDRKSGLEIRTFHGHSKSVKSIDISPDLKYLASGSADGTAIIWDILTGEILFQTPAEKKILTSVKFLNPSFFVTAGLNDEAKVWSIEKKKTIARIPVTPDQGLGSGVSISVSPDKKLIAFGEDNRSFKIVDTKKWEIIATEIPANGFCGGCGTLTDFNSDGSKLLVVPQKEQPYIYSIKEQSKIDFAIEYEEAVSAFFIDETENIVIAEKNYARKVNVQTGIVKDSISFNANANKIALAGKNLLAVGMDNNTVSLYSWSEKQQIQTFQGILNEAEKTGIDYDPNNYWESHIAKYLRLKNPILFEKDNKRYLKGKSGLKVKSWDIYSGKPVAEFTGHEKAVVTMKLSHNGEFLATGGADGLVKIWNLKERNNILTIPAHKAPVFSVDFNPVYKQIVSSSWDGTIKVWDIHTGKEISRIDLKNNSAYEAAFTRDGLYIITSDLGKKLLMWEPDSKTVVREFLGHTDVVSSIDFSNDGKHLLTGSWDGSIRIWNIQTGLMTKKILSTSTPIHNARFSNDEKVIISAGDDRVINIHDTETSVLLKTLYGHKAEITSLDQSLDGNYLLSYSLDGIIKLWDFKEKYPIFDHIHIGAKDWMVKNQEGYFNGTDGAIRKVHFVNGLQPYKAEQFFEKYYRPDLLKKSAHGRKRTGGTQSLKNNLLENPLPSLKIAAYPDPSGENAIILVKIKDEGGGVVDLKVRHNGKGIPIRSINFPQKPGEEIVYTDTLKMVGGKNVFSASAKNSEKVESFITEAELFSESTEKSATCHIMVIGLNKYKNASLNLGFAKADAEGFAITMNNKGQELYNKIVVHSLYDDMADKGRILDTLDKLSKEVHLHDVFMFFYAGHGTYQNGQFYLIPNNCTRAYDESVLEETAISAELLQRKFEKIKALKQIVIMDACHSGGSVEVLASRGTMEEKAIAQLARSAGIHILASSGEEQVSKEVKELEHGIFTYVLLKGLSGAADGAPADGKITVYELKSYIDDQVPLLNEKYSGKAQYPYTFSRGQDFPVCLE